jgi:hypothetical protein
VLIAQLLQALAADTKGRCNFKVAETFCCGTTIENNIGNNPYIHNQIKPITGVTTILVVWPFLLCSYKYLWR